MGQTAKLSPSCLQPACNRRPTRNHPKDVCAQEARVFVQHCVGLIANIAMNRIAGTSATCMGLVCTWQIKPEKVTDMFESQAATISHASRKRRGKQCLQVGGATSTMRNS